MIFLILMMRVNEMEDIKDNFIPYEEAKELERLKWDDFHFGLG